MDPPEPPAAIPDFLLEQLTELSPRTLRDVGEYARNNRAVAPETVPESIVTAFALQDDDTLDAIAGHADALAAFLEDRDAESLAEIGDGQTDEEEDWAHKRILEWHG